MNIFIATASWFRFVEENKRIIKPVHGAIMQWCFSIANEKRWPKEFQLPTAEACEMTGITDKETFLKALKNLVEFGAITVVSESTNRYTARWVSLDNAEFYRPIFSDATTNATPDATTYATTNASTTNLNKEKKESIKEEKKRDSSPKVRFDPKEIELPYPGIEFKEAWSNWCDHKGELKDHITPQSSKQQLNKLKKYNEPIAIAMINKAIEKGWKGLYDLDESDLAKLKMPVQVSDENLSPEVALERERRKTNYEQRIRGMMGYEGKPIDFPANLSVYHLKTGFYNELKK